MLINQEMHNKILGIILTLLEQKERVDRKKIKILYIKKPFTILPYIIKFVNNFLSFYFIFNNWISFIYYLIIS